jgi:putative AlgH/UPF0301 family transcriptional regulator
VEMTATTTATDGHSRRISSFSQSQMHMRRQSSVIVNDRTPEQDVYNYGGPVSPDRGQGLHATTNNMHMAPPSPVRANEL